MKILNHLLTQTEACKKELKNYNPLDFDNIDDYKSNHVGELFNNFIWSLSKTVDNDCAIDRTGEHNFLNVKYSPIPEIPKNWDRDFADICDERALGLWSLGKPLRVWWSGGIDSTTALTALINTKKSEDELIVYMGKPCIEEFPSYYEKIKKMGITIEWNTKENMFSMDKWDGSAINITGECGDPMYGTFVIENHIEELDDHWHKTFDYQDVNFVYRDSHLRKRFMDFAEKHVSKCPFEIKTPFDFTWWVAFTTKWQWTECRWYGFLDDPSRWYNMISFFNYPEFQLWSMTKHHLKHRNTYKTYKWPSKEYIYKFNPDDDYLNHKTKEKSLPKTMGPGGYKRNFICWDDGTYYPLLDTGETTGVIPTDISIWELFNKSECDKYKKMEITHV